MDEYIKMCNCPEIQDRHEWKDGDYYTCTTYFTNRTPRTQVEIGIYCSSCESDYPPPQFPKEHWLPRQEDIQGMLKDDSLDIMFPHVVLLGNIYRAVTNMELSPTETMEQLFLCYYMKEKHNKVWDGGKWVKVSIMEHPMWE
jgi:hypothetical protein